MHSNILKYKHFQPKIHCSAFISDTAVITGDVTIGDGSSVWFNAVLRGDVASIKIGEKTNIQDGSIIHVSRNGGNSFIGNNVTVGHKVLLHACRLCDECFIGMGSIILDGAIVESGAMLAAGSLLTGGKKINSGELWAGSPAKFFRKLTAEESKSILISSENYYNLAQEYMDKKQWGKKND